MQYVALRRLPHKTLEATRDVVIALPAPGPHVLNLQSEVEKMLVDIFIHRPHVRRPVRIGRRERVEIRCALGLDDFVRREMVFASSHNGFLPQDATGYQMRRDTKY